jgi:hypothetical protein
MASTFPQMEEETISKAQYYDLIYAQSGYLYTVLPDTPRLVPFSEEKPGMSHSVDGLIGTTTHHNSYIQPPPMYNTPQYPPMYGGPPRYPPPLYQQPYPDVLPPCMSGPSLTPIMCQIVQPSFGTPSTSSYTLSTSESPGPSYVPYKSFPQNNMYFPLPGPPYPIAPP